MAKTEGEKQIEAQRKAQADAVKELDRRAAEARPTPTQDENDRAKLGILDIDAKQPDGSPEQRTGAPPASPAVRTAAPASDAASYSTRDAAKKG